MRLDGRISYQNTFFTACLVNIISYIPILLGTIFLLFFLCGLESPNFLEPILNSFRSSAYASDTAIKKKPIQIEIILDDYRRKFLLYLSGVCLRVYLELFLF